MPTLRRNPGLWRALRLRATGGGNRQSAAQERRQKGTHIRLAKQQLVRTRMGGVAPMLTDARYTENPIAYGNDPYAEAWPEEDDDAWEAE